MYIERGDGDHGVHGYVSEVGSNLHVTPDNVLAIRDAIRDAVDEAYDQLQMEISKFKLWAACAQDPVSLDAQVAWNYRLVDWEHSHANRINDYISGLYALVDKLTATAQTYGLTEQANAETLRGTGD